MRRFWIARPINKTPTIAGRITAESFTLIAMAQATESASALSQVILRPARHVAIIVSNIASAIGTSFFTSDACARKFG